MFVDAIYQAKETWYGRNGSSFHPGLHYFVGCITSTANAEIAPASSVLDLNCKAHRLDNLYVADSSFFPSIGAVNPTLTIIAKVLAVLAVLAARLLLSALICSSR